MAEGRFYRFDQVYGAHELGYRGPPFGWWDITDQCVFCAPGCTLGGRPSVQPLFVFFPTISTHTPFTPTPPYQPDWKRILTTTPYVPTSWIARGHSRRTGSISAGLHRALDYIHATLAGYSACTPAVTS